MNRFLRCLLLVFHWIAFASHEDDDWDDSDFIKFETQVEVIPFPQNPPPLELVFKRKEPLVLKDSWMDIFFFLDPNATSQERELLKQAANEMISRFPMRRIHIQMEEYPYPNELPNTINYAYKRREP